MASLARVSAGNDKKNPTLFRRKNPPPTVQDKQNKMVVKTCAVVWDEEWDRLGQGFFIQ